MQPSSALPIIAIIGLSLVACSSPKETTKTETPAITDKWKLSQSRSPMDENISYILGLDAEGTDAVRPRFVAACSKGDLRVYVDTRTLLSQDPDLSDYGWNTVGRYRIDQEEAQRFSWETSTDHRAIFVPKETGHLTNFAADFLNQLLSAQAVHFEYNPLDSGPKIAAFDVRGLAGHLDKLRAMSLVICL